MKRNFTELFNILQERFQQKLNPELEISWDGIEQRLCANQDKLLVLFQMEESGGEPNLVDVEDDGTLVFFDCYAECPEQRKSLCYDEEARQKRKNNTPLGSVELFVETIGSELLSEEDYFFIQTLGDFDLKTSSWLATPDDIRDLKGAIFGDKRYGRTFIYHNSAESYYSSRGFRTKLLIP